MWSQRNDFEIGDIVYLYSVGGSARITHKVQVVAKDMSFEGFGDFDEYWSDANAYGIAIQYNRFCEFKQLQVINNEVLSFQYMYVHGLKSVARPFELNGELLEFINDVLTNNYAGLKNSVYVDAECVGDEENFFEGAVMNVKVNKYERNPEARKKCIEKHGCRCVICGFDFEQTYGIIGKGFIHVHHLIPISSIKKEYVVDPEKDLIPVCPNCHSMLHQGENGTLLTPGDLKQKLSEQIHNK